MHPFHFEHARSLHVLGAVLALIAVSLGIQGCTSSSPPDRSEVPFMPSDTITSAVDRDSALTVLSDMRRSAFDSAFAVLDEYEMTRYVRTEQLTPAGATTAVRSHTLRYPKGDTTVAATIQRHDSLGAFRGGGFLEWATPERNPTDRPSNVAAQVLPDQPSYVEPRTREAYRYALRGDTLRTGTPVYVLEATARDWGTGREQSVRYVRLLIERASRQLIGLALVRAGDGLLFGENSHMSLRLRQAPGSRRGWVPHVTRVRVSVHVPFREPRQFRTVSAYYHYRR